MKKKVCDHKSVGVLVRNGDRYLFIERRLPPYGWAAPAGHIDSHNDYETAAKAEVREEVGILARDLKLVLEGWRDNPCRRIDGGGHYWKVFEIDVSDWEVVLSNREAVTSEWLDRNQLLKLSTRTDAFLKGDVDDNSWRLMPGLEPVWQSILTELNLI